MERRGNVHNSEEGQRDGGNKGAIQKERLKLRNTEAKQQDLQEIEVDKIDRPGVVDRITIDQEEVESLAQSIQQQGLLQAPVLRPKQGRFEIVAGDRRIMAIKTLDWKKIKCAVKEMSDLEAAEIRGSENLQRENLTIIEEAKIYKNLHETHGRTLEQIAKRMGKSAGTIKRRMDLLTMPPRMQKALHEKKINYGVAEALWGISDEAALDYYLGFAIDHGVTVTIARQWTKDWKDTVRRQESQPGKQIDTLSPPMERPVYIGCDLCREPELVQELKSFRVCRACAKELMKVANR